MDTNVKAALMAAIRDYRSAAQHIGSARQLLEQLSAVEQDIERLPDPLSQGEGSVPNQKPGASGQRDMTPGQKAAQEAGVHIHIHSDGDGPSFPSRSTLMRRMGR